MKIHRCLFFAVPILALILTASFHAQAKEGPKYRVKVIAEAPGVSKAEKGRVKGEALKALRSVCPILRIRYNKILEVRITKSGASNSLGGKVSINIQRVRAKTAPIVHEVTHVVTGHGESRFFAEGLAIYFQERFGQDDHGQFSTKTESLDDLVRSNKLKLMSLTYLAQHNEVFQDRNNPRRTVAYLQAGSFFSFLATTYGAKKLKRLHDTAKLNYQRIYGKSLKQLETAWRTHLFGPGKGGGATGAAR